MKSGDLLVSSLSITEDEYDYKGIFILSGGEKSFDVNLAEFESIKSLQQIKDHFELEETFDEIKQIVMDKVMESASISSRHTEGENFEESSRRKIVEKSARSLDMA